MNVWLMLFRCPDEMDSSRCQECLKAAQEHIVTVLTTRPRLDHLYSSQLDSSPSEEAVTVRGEGSTDGLIK